MVTHLGHPPHYFDSDEHSRQHSFPRAYIRNADYNHKVCTVIYRNSPVTLADFPILFGTSRAEMYREQAIELWRTGLPIIPVPRGARSYQWHHLDIDEPPTSKEELQKLIITRRMEHPYTLIFLEAIKHSGGASQRQLANLLFHTFKKGSVDQVHPTYGDLDVNETKKGKGWGLIKEGRLTEKADLILDTYEGGLVFVCARTDFDENREKVRLLWSILREIELCSGLDVRSYPFPLPRGPHTLSIEAILKRFGGPGLGKIPMASQDKIELMLDDLGIYSDIDGDELTLDERIFLSITPSMYVSAGLYHMDGMKNRLLDPPMKDLFTQEDVGYDGKIWVIGDDFNPDNYPEDSINISELLEWRDLSRSINQITPKAIIFAPEWSPAFMELASGELHAYVAAGGEVIIHRHKSTRIGTSKMFFTGLPQDIDRFSHLPENGWRFDTKLGPWIGDPQPIYAQKFRPENPASDTMSHFVMGYGEGIFAFVDDDPSRVLYGNFSERRKPPSFTDSPHWKWRKIANLYRHEDITREQSTYPILGASVLRDHLGFELTETFAHQYQPGVANQHWCDLVILAPAPILFEVDTIGGGGGSRFGSLAGESTAITDYHVERQAGWFHSANGWCHKLLDIIKSCIGEPMELANISRLITEEGERGVPTKMPFMRELYMKHLSLVHNKSPSPGAAEIAQSLSEALERIGGRPGSIVIGTNYGWREGMKASARETSIENGTSLWTYLDLYEFLVRTDDWEVDERQQAFVDILAKDGGPVCWHVAEL